MTTEATTAYWMLDAGAQYEMCRQRLDTLIDWHIQGEKP